MTNREICERFASSFTPKLAVAHVLNIDGTPAEDCWMCASGNHGFTAFAIDGCLRVLAERTRKENPK